MTSLQEYTSLIGGFQGILLFALLISDDRMTAASRILGWLCIVSASVFLMPFFLLNADSALAVRIVSWIVLIPSSSGALCYLFCRSALHGHPISSNDVVYFCPWLLCYLLSIDIVIGEPQEMTLWAAGAPARTWRLQASELLLFVQAFGFAGLTSRMIWQYHRKAQGTSMNFNPSLFRWLFILQVFTLVVWILRALPALTNSPDVLSDIGNLCLVFLIYVIAFMHWRNPHLFAVAGRPLETPNIAAIPLVRDTTCNTGELDPTTRAELFAIVQDRMETNRQYLDSDLTLKRLADVSGMSKHHLSEVLNKHAGQNFYDFVNGYRVVFAKELLTNNRTARVIDVAAEAGFSSKSTFNATFKKLTGKTPSQFRDQARINARK